jgi:excinuclease ABC subunit A
MSSPVISVRGAREHNLRNVSLDLPRNQLICFTGVSGSGKSSLAFDTLYAEGQRRYVESLSAYARQFLGQLSKPDVDQITGLSPAIAIQQKATGWNPRSTVGTVTGIYDFLRVLYARAGRQHCPTCGRQISAQTQESIVARILALPPGTAVLILAPVIRGQKGEHVELIEDLRRQGYVRARIDGQVVRLVDPPKLGRNNRHNIEVVIDRLTIRDGIRGRLAEAVESALTLGEGTILVAPAVSDEPREDGETERRRDGENRTPNASEWAGPDDEREKKAFARDLVLSSKYACSSCGIGFDPPSPQLFSFNSPTGMCLSCDGMGTRNEFDPELLVPDPSQPFLTPCVAPMRTRPGRWRRHIYLGVANHVGFDLSQPWKELPQKARDALLYGTGDAHITYEWKSFGRVWKHGGTFEGVIADLEAKYRAAKADFIREYYEKFMRHGRCEDCGGARLNPQARAVKVGGRPLHELCAMSVREARAFLGTLELTPTETLIAAEVLKEVRGRLAFLSDVGLDYLALDRTAPTLAGGESQRIRLAGQIGCGLVGVLYVLDEPSIGLHPRDNQKLLASLERLRDLGNTVVVVEHDEETMRAADLIVDFGPGPGVRGGHVVTIGTLEEIAADPKSITGAYLSGRQAIEVPAERRPVDVGSIQQPAKKAKAPRKPKESTSK